MTRGRGPSRAEASGPPYNRSLVPRRVPVLVYLLLVSLTFGLAIGAFDFAVFSRGTLVESVAFCGLGSAIFQGIMLRFVESPALRHRGAKVALAPFPLDFVTVTSVVAVWLLFGLILWITGRAVGPPDFHLTPTVLGLLLLNVVGMTALTRLDGGFGFRGPNARPAFRRPRT